MSKAGNRFDAPDHVQTWRRHGRFPKIHDPIGQFVREEIAPGNVVVLDLCSSSGLLGRRLMSYGYGVVAAQEPAPGLDVGRAGGVYDPIPVFDRRIVEGTVPAFLEWMEDHHVEVIVARRCISELFTSLGAPRLEALAAGWAAIGVRSVLLQGRAKVPNPTHPVPDTAAEIRVLGPAWRVERWDDPLAHLTPER